MSEDNRPYEVGYGKPPEGGKFAKGKSGNPKGRPKGSKNIANIFLRESRQTVRINGPRGPRSVTKLEAAVMQLGNKAAQGDARALHEFFSQNWKAEEISNSAASSPKSNELDQKVMQSILARMKAGVEPKTTNQETEKEGSQ